MACGDCKHFERQKNPDTGRVLPSQPGACKYPVKWPTLPGAYYGWRGNLNWPTPSGVWPGSCDKCQMWEPKKKNAQRLIDSQGDLLRPNAGNEGPGKAQL